MLGHHLKRLQKLHAHLNFLPPYHAARTARLVTIEDKVKGAWDWAVNHNLGPCFRKIANDALHGDAITPDNLCTF